MVRDISGNSSYRLLSRRRPGIPYEKEYALQSDGKIHMRILCISDRVESMLQERPEKAMITSKAALYVDDVLAAEALLTEAMR